MTISVGDKLPDATLLKMGADGPEQVRLSELSAGRKIVIFGVPGAYTGVCTNAHVPGFIKAKDQLMEKGVQDIICVAVNDPFVVQAWGDSTGATEAGITMLGDASAEFTKAMGMAFSAPPAGFYDRSKRYAMLVENDEIKILNTEDNPGMCDASAAETLLGQI